MASAAAAASGRNNGQRLVAVEFSNYADLYSHAEVAKRRQSPPTSKSTSKNAAAAFYAAYSSCAERLVRAYAGYARPQPHRQPTTTTTTTTNNSNVYMAYFLCANLAGNHNQLESNNDDDDDDDEMSDYYSSSMCTTLFLASQFVYKLTLDYYHAAVLSARFQLNYVPSKVKVADAHDEHTRLDDMLKFNMAKMLPHSYSSSSNGNSSSSSSNGCGANNNDELLAQFELNLSKRRLWRRHRPLDDDNDDVAGGVELDTTRRRLIGLLASKLDYFNEQLILNVTSGELNEKLGKKILGWLEAKPANSSSSSSSSGPTTTTATTTTTLSRLELDKYKLLVSETDVIAQLLLRLCSKLANTDNLIQIMQLKRMQMRASNAAKSDDNEKQNNGDDEDDEDDDDEEEESARMAEEIEILKQDMSQIQRKKEEALFLKSGIDKRALNVSNILAK